MAKFIQIHEFFLQWKDLSCIAANIFPQPGFELHERGLERAQAKNRLKVGKAACESDSIAVGKWFQGRRKGYLSRRKIVLDP